MSNDIYFFSGFSVHRLQALSSLFCVESWFVSITIDDSNLMYLLHV